MRKKKNMNSYEVTLDLETQNTFQDVGGHDTAQLKISLVGVHTSHDNQYRAYMEDELNALWPVLEHADCIIGYNHKLFDMPVLNNYYAGDCTKFPLLDLMEEVHKQIGYRPKLDSLAVATLGTGKTGHGLDAVRYWKAGEIEKLKQYCLDDVRITRQLYEFGRREKYVLLHERFGEPKKVAVTFSMDDVKKSTVNLTLGL